MYKLELHQAAELINIGELSELQVDLRDYVSLINFHLYPKMHEGRKGIKHALGSCGAKKQPIIEKFDLSDAYDSESEAELLLIRLKELGYEKHELLFRGIDGKKLDTVRKHGKDNLQFETIFCGNSEQLMDPGILEYALINGGQTPAIAVYDKEKLSDNSGLIVGTYKFNEGIRPIDALIAVFLLKY